MSVSRTFSILIYPMTLLLFLVGPLTVYFIFRNKEDARFHLRNAMNLQLTVLIAYVVALILFIMPYIFPLAIAAAIFFYQFMFIVVGMVKANEGEEHKTWGTIPFMRPDA